MTRFKGVSVAVLLLLAACGQSELYSDLSEQQANEMVAVLRNGGIDADKKALDGGKWSIGAPNDSFSRAVEILHANGYPKDRFDTMGDLFKKEGFVSSPLEERARLNYGLTQELSNTISHIDGVVEARVHLAMPAPDPLAEEQKPSSASVFVKHRPGMDLQRQTGQIKALVVNAIEGLSYDRVSVVFFAAQPLPTPHTSTAARIGDYAGLVIPALLGGAAFLLWPLWKKRKLPGRRRALVLRE